MTPLAEKLRWPIGTRVVYTGKYGAVTCETMSTPYKLRCVPWVSVDTGTRTDVVFLLRELERTPRWDVSVRWELHCKGEVAEFNIAGDYISRWPTRRQALMVLRVQRSAFPDEKLTLVRITTKRKVKP